MLFCSEEKRFSAHRTAVLAVPALLTVPAAATTVKAQKMNCEPHRYHHHHHHTPYTVAAGAVFTPICQTYSMLHIHISHTPNTQAKGARRIRIEFYIVMNILVLSLLVFFSSSFAVLLFIAILNVCDQFNVFVPDFMILVHLFFDTFSVFASGCWRCWCCWR